MYRKGHVGLSLLIFPLLFIPFGVTYLTLTFLGFSVAFSTFPDWDQKWDIKHRAYTHNIGFGLLSGIIIGFTFGYFFGLYVGILIFSAVLAGVMSHLLGDIIAEQNIDGTPWKIKPFQPFSDNAVGYGIVKALNENVNKSFLVVWAIVFFGVFEVRNCIKKL